MQTKSLTPNREKKAGNLSKGRYDASGKGQMQAIQMFAHACNALHRYETISWLK